MITFDEFKKISYGDWAEKTTKDLKGKDLKEVLNWQISESLTGEAYYDESLAKEAGYITDFFSEFKPDAWKLYEPIKAGDPSTTNQEILNALENGCDGIILNSEDELPLPDWEIILKDVHTNICDVSFVSPASEKILSAFSEYLIKTNKILRSGLSFTSTGENTIPGFRNICIKDPNESDPVIKTSLQVKEVIHLLDKGGEEALKKAFIVIESQPDFYLGVVRPRAIRFLLVAAAKSMNIELDPKQVYIHANPLQGKDYKESMLQNTAIGMANVIGGVNSIHFELGNEKPEGFSKRISRNIGNLMREESNMVFEKDPSAGSYFIDTITHQFCKEVWNRIKR